ncbi:unnamed protein product [Gongylonema pulchrum]|uniref:Uncharacterized protein n=1 Tax=Gongylonema pulchrum TaxID=637853 RepID=A0A183F002_9BILA|nr:unnamed protein product [Gongylonema pulchrum]
MQATGRRQAANFDLPASASADTSSAQPIMALQAGRQTDALGAKVQSSRHPRNGTERRELCQKKCTSTVKWHQSARSSVTA